MNDQALSDLAARLAGARADATPLELSGEEGRVVAAALLELASSQTTLALQRSLLASYDEDLQAIDRAAAGALQGIAKELQDAAAPIDLASTAEARRALIDDIRSARSIEHALTVVLRFALIAGRLA